MNLKSQYRKWVYLGLFVLSILFIFFLGKKFSPETGVRNWSFDVNGLQYFRKGLDVSGGTRLTYKIDYDKYEEIYKGKTAQLKSIKQNVENILFKQIDKRISSLGVADAKVYKQLMDGKAYINVDIGGISDLDQAKGIIGKTVELEFRLPVEGKPSAKEKLEREALANKMHKELSTNPEKFTELSENKGSQSIYYTHFTGVSAEQLPPMLQNNIQLIDGLKKGQVASKLLSGVYTYAQVSAGSGQIGLEPVSGYGVVLLNDKKEVSLDTITSKDVKNLAKKLSLTTNENEEILDKAIAKTSFVDKNTYNLYNEVAGAGKAMYKVKVAFITPSLSGGDNKSIVDAVVEKIKTSDSFSGATLLLNDEWKTEEEIKSIVSKFSPLDSFNVYEEMNGKYVVSVSKIKAESQIVYNHISVANVAKNFVEQLTKNMVYDIEVTFVQDKEPWVAAKTRNNKILNGAYFKFAKPGVGQLGESVVEINFNDEGKQIFCDITNENIGKQMAIFVGGKLMTNPVIRSKICGGTAQISGSYTPESAKKLSEDLNDGALPAPLILLQEEKISPVLGEQALNYALLAGLVGVVAIFVFVLLMYGLRKALVTIGVLTMFLLVLGLFMKVVDYALSLSAIAAVILSVGMAVDANILIFERMREEIAEGKKTKVAIDSAYDRSWFAIKDGNVTTGIIAFLLFAMGNSIFKWFGSMLIVTVLLTLFVNVPLTKIFLELVYKNIIKKESKK